MNRAGLLFFSLFLGGVALASASPAALGSDAAQVQQLVRAGVDDSVVVAFIQTHQPRLVVSSEDVAQLKASGASSAVIAALTRPAPSQTVVVTESRLYRLYFGQVFHDGQVADLGSGLPLSWQEQLEANPSARLPIQSFVRGHATAQGLGWGGFGLVLGGLLYAGIGQAVAPQSVSVNNTIGLSALGAGVLSMITSSFIDGDAYRNLYTGLYQYNQDLVIAGSGGHS